MTLKLLIKITEDPPVLRTKISQQSGLAYLGLTTIFTFDYRIYQLVTRRKLYEMALKNPLTNASCV